MNNLIMIGHIDDLTQRIRAKHYGAYVVTNYDSGKHEVYAWENEAEYVKRMMFNQFSLMEKGGKYYYVTIDREIEITFCEYNELKSKK